MDGERVRVHLNLHKSTPKKKVWSVLKNGRVVAHVTDILLEDTKAIVREGGRKRAIREKQKNVHAFIEGTVRSLRDGEILPTPHGLNAIKYSLEFGFYTRKGGLISKMVSFNSIGAYEVLSLPKVNLITQT